MASYSTGAPAPAPPHEPPSPQLVLQDPPKPSSLGKWITVAVFLAAAGAAAWLYLRPAPAKRVPVSVRTATVRHGPVRKTLRLSGVTAPSRFAMLLAPQMTGARHGRGASEFQQILQKVVTAGSFVKKGEVVAEFERMYMLLRLDDYKAVVVQHEAYLRSLNAMLEVRRKNYEQTTIRYRGARDKAALEMKKSPVLSAIKAEKNQLNLQQYSAQFKEIEAEAKFFEESERAAIRRLELDLRVTRMEFERAKRNADAMLVKAPIDGLAVMQTIRRGADTGEVRAGDQLFPGQPYMQIVDVNSICVDAAVNQVDIEKLRLGAQANIAFDAYPGLELPAHVISIGALANSKGWRANYVKDVPVRLQLEKMDPRVIPNFSVSAEVLLEEVDGTAAVPREGLFSEDGKTFAYVKAAAGWERREVEIGLAGNTLAEVRSGLNAGDIVAAEPPIVTGQ